jgi:phosphate acetyltransferase/phosphate butyryltransferase
VAVAFTHPRLAALVERARERLRGRPPPRLAIAWPCDVHAREAAEAIAEEGIAQPVLVGPRARLAALGFDARLPVVETADDAGEAARAAVALAREGDADALMKGSLHTDELMAAVIARRTGLHGARRPSHVFLFDLPRYPKLLALADCVISIQPSLQTKRAILANALDLLRTLGIARPLVGIVAAVESVMPAIPATVDARALVEAAARGEFGAAIVEGPFGFDNAFSAEAARTKGLRSQVAGDADLLLLPDLNSANILYKSFVHAAGADCAGLVLGTRVPVVLTSRADSLQARLASVALAVLATH